MNTENIWFALGLTLFAGLSTGIGSMLAFFSKNLIQSSWPVLWDFQRVLWFKFRWSKFLLRQRIR